MISSFLLYHNILSKTRKSMRMTIKITYMITSNPIGSMSCPINQGINIAPKPTPKKNQLVV